MYIDTRDEKGENIKVHYTQIYIFTTELNDILQLYLDPVGEHRYFCPWTNQNEEDGTNILTIVIFKLFTWHLISVSHACILMFNFF